MEPAHATGAQEVHLLGPQSATDEQLRTALALRKTLQHRKTTGYAVRMARREHGVTPERRQLVVGAQRIPGAVDRAVERPRQTVELLEQRLTGVHIDLAVDVEEAEDELARARVDQPGGVGAQPLEVADGEGT